jgi:Flp pilus assembly pilin Flp
MNRTRHTGQAAVEYLVVVSLLAVALLGGERGVAGRIASAIGEQYQRFSWSVAQP